MNLKNLIPDSKEGKFRILNFTVGLWFCIFAIIELVFFFYTSVYSVVNLLYIPEFVFGFEYPSVIVESIFYIEYIILFLIGVSLLIPIFRNRTSSVFYYVFVGVGLLEVHSQFTGFMTPYWMTITFFFIPLTIWLFTLRYVTPNMGRKNGYLLNDEMFHKVIAIGFVMVVIPNILLFGGIGAVIISIFLILYWNKDIIQKFRVGNSRDSE